MASNPRIPGQADPAMRGEAIRMRQMERGGMPPGAGAPSAGGGGGQANALREHLAAAYEIISGASSDEELVEFAPIIKSFFVSLQELTQEEGPGDAAQPGAPPPAGGTPPSPVNDARRMQGAGSLQL
jgi:hypothetical protein